MALLYTVHSILQEKFLSQQAVIYPGMPEALRPQAPSSLFADQLTLSQPVEADFAPTLLNTNRPSPDFRPSDIPDISPVKNSLNIYAQESI